MNKAFFEGCRVYGTNVCADNQHFTDYVHDYVHDLDPKSIIVIHFAMQLHCFCIKIKM